MVPSLSSDSSVKAHLHRLLDLAIRDTGSMGIAIARRDGLPIAHRLRGNADARLAAAMAAGILGTVASIAAQLEQGDVHDIVASCSGGKIVAMQAGLDAVIIAWYPLKANVGLVLIGLQDAAQRIAQALEET
jgi:predicted regulator of Ras-like GTPase activity (Roadblock/LC7/MglB family)